MTTTTTTITVIREGAHFANAAPCEKPVSERLADRLHTARLAGFCVLLMFGPLAFGAVETWSFCLLQAGTAVLFLLWSVEQAFRGRIQLTASALYAPMFGFGLWTLGLVLFHPPAYRLPSEIGLLAYAGYALLFFLAVECCRSREDMVWMCKLLATFGLAVAIFAIIQGFASNGKLYWVRQPQFTGWIYGPYVNHGHYAALMLMLAPLALLVGLSPSLSRDTRIFFLFSAAVMGASVFTSQSRGGVIAFIVEMAVFAAGVLAGRKKPGLLVSGFVLAIFAFGFWCAGSGLLTRLENLEDTKIRLSIAQDTLHMIAARPATGWGLGNFQYSFPQFQTFYTDKLVDHAHNDYLETLAETGIPGGLFALLFIGLLYGSAIPAMERWHASPRCAMKVAAMIGCTGLFVQELMDFNMHIPGNVAIFLFLAAVATSKSARRMKAS
jgi:O-antigen ligase